MSSKSETSKGGIGFCGLLAIVFITLKLAEIGAVATWSWLWVLSPIWLPITVVLSIIAICAVVVYLIDRK